MPSLIFLHLTRITVLVNVCSWGDLATSEKVAKKIEETFYQEYLDQTCICIESV
jgi:hypothetical protein